MMENFDDLIKIKTNNIRPGPGKILISEPFLYDYYFRRSVVLLAEHNKEGSFGVIINKPMSLRFDEVVKDFPDFGARIFLGGPVSTDSLFFIHTLGETISGSLPILDGLFWGGDLEQVKTMITLGQLDGDKIRFFVGYSGWMAKQLSSELKRDSWLVSKLTATQVMHSDPDALWQDSVKELGRQYASWTLLPKDPGLN